jgi:hypothetical protein
MENSKKNLNNKISKNFKNFREFFFQFFGYFSSADYLGSACKHLGGLGPLVYKNTKIQKYKMSHLFD